MDSNSTYNLALKVSGAFKSFKKNKNVINNLHMNVPKGVIGGQSRRVSIAVSLLHDPNIIILDEPTVGLDPILSKKIWDYFAEIVEQKNKTIIITTHYIQEASQADLIGLMRHGIIMEEAPPKSFLIKYNTDFLEDAFLEMCNNPTVFYEGRSSSISDCLKKKHNFFEKTDRRNSYLSSHRIKALLQKNFLVSCRDFMYFFFVYLLPIVQVILLNTTIGNKLEFINIAVSNKETNLTRCSNFNVSSCLYDNYINETLSCDFVNSLKDLEYNIEYVNDFNEGIMAVDNGWVDAFIYFPNNYSKGMHQYIEQDEQFSLDSVSFIHVGNRDFITKQQVIMDLNKATNNVLLNTISHCYSTKNVLNVPMKLQKEYGAKINLRRHGTIGKDLILLTFYFSSACSASFMLLEKLDGLLSRSMVAGVTLLEVMIALLIIQSFGFFLQNIIMVLISYVCYDNPYEISSGLYLVFFVFIITSWNGFIYGLIVAGLSRNSTEVMFLTFGYGLVQVLIGGVMWPIEAQVWFLRIVSYNLPMTVNGRLLTNLVVKGLPLGHPEIVIDFVKSIAHIFVHIGAVFSLKYIKNDSWIIHK
ncbi:ABC transporter G family member 23-like isoform X2 [Daktulosphaira vitifoliae]|uniref:ABC transporter G family member 23-like isoform X2 n=1 Tax=Daktulosphaira vitifoliae TaxID=58002 RepID=UPI0021A9D45E|nr:ABC transporter G family member 23-like isoform X2 [Daktulosphaira vitifoliae]